MSDKVTAGFGLVAFFAVIALPFWFSFTAAAPANAPVLVLPDTATACVEDTDYMRSSHMELLNSWRTQVVRQGRQEYVSSAGTSYRMSLTQTCLGCHSSVDSFCDSCHEFADVHPTCWNCHVQPGGN